MQFGIDIFTTLALASAARVVGRALTRRVAFLSNYSIPDAVVGGMLMNVVVKAMGGGFAAALAATVGVAGLAFAVGTVPFLVRLVKQVRR